MFEWLACLYSAEFCCGFSCQTSISGAQTGVLIGRRTWPRLPACDHLWSAAVQSLSRCGHVSTTAGSDTPPPAANRCKGKRCWCCLTSQQHASVSQGRICSDNCTFCHTETEVADQTFHLTQSLYTDTGPTSPSTDPNAPGAWQGSRWSANFYVTGMMGFEPSIFRYWGGYLNHLAKEAVDKRWTVAKASSQLCILVHQVCNEMIK